LDLSKKAGIANFNDLRNSLGQEEAKTLVVAAAHDMHTLEAVFAAAKEFPMRYILVGKKEKILALSSELGVRNGMDTIIDCGNHDDCAREAVKIVREGRGDVLVKGILESSALLKAVLDKDSGIRDSGVLSHLAFLEVPSYHKLVVITDGGAIPNPTLEQKAEIVRNAVTFYRRLGIHRPKIAALCINESVSEKIPETVDAAALQKMCERGELGDCVLEGPISFDLAVDTGSAKIKGFKSAITGDPDILLVPNITVGNVMSKALLYWGGAKMAGCVVGAKAPIVLVSRGATAEEKLLSIMLCLIHS